MSLEMACAYYENMKCKKDEEPGYVNWCVLGPCARQTPSMADKIRAMTDEDLAHFLHGFCENQEHCYFCPLYDKACGGVDSTAEQWLDWLKRPAEEVEREYAGD